MVILYSKANYMKKIFVAIACCFLFVSVEAQTLTIDGYAFESGNRGFLNATQIKVYDKDKEMVLGESVSDLDGHFVCEVPVESKYVIVAYKEMFEEFETELSNTKNQKSGKLFAKLELKRAPGYIFEITLAESRDDEDTVVDAIKGADIEVYNNTTGKMDLTLEDHPIPNFRTNLLKGNHYTVLVRKPGYFTKRMEAFVDIEDCILCFDGIGDVRPGVTDNLTEGNANGVLLANVGMDPVFLGKEIQFRNILYNFGSAELTPSALKEIDKLIVLIKDNPNLKIELGSHTDSRGKEEDNMALSIKRAQSVVNYILEHSDIPRSSISARGYGETDLLNDCTSFAECPEEKHLVNRRTEMKIIGIDESIPLPSLAYEIKKKKEAALIEELLNQKQVRIPLEGEEGENPFEKILAEEDENKEEDEQNVQDEQDEEKPFTEKLLEPGTKGSYDERIVGTKEDALKRKKGLKKKKVDKEMSDLEKKLLEESQAKAEQEEEMKNQARKDMTILEKASSIDTELKTKVVSRVVIHEHETQLTKANALYLAHEDLQEYKTKKGLYIYTIGDFENEKDAIKFLTGVAKRQYSDAYIVNFVNGVLESELENSEKY